MDFQFPEEIDPVFVEGEPEQSFAMVGLSLLLPYLEPYLIRSMKQARKLVRDSDLAQDLDHFSAQESQHYQQHRRFNEALHLQGFPQLQALESELDADYRRFSRTKSLRFNLAYAEGFEALTTASARFAFENDIIRNMHPAASQLFTWHLIEELEHRTVAFEVYEHVCRNYPYRLVVGLFAQWHMTRFIARVASHMIQSSPQIVERYGGLAGSRNRRRALGRRALRGFLPKLLATYTPWYTPARIEFSAEMRAMAEEYSAMAVEQL